MASFPFIIKTAAVLKRGVTAGSAVKTIILRNGFMFWQVGAELCLKLNLIS